MATDRKSDEILLNALADGELSPAEQASAAARLRTDRDFARAYATLSRLKADIVQFAAEHDTGDIELAGSLARNNRRFAFAAAAALALIVGSVAYFTVPMVQPDRADTPAQENLVSVAFAGEAIIPDLSSEGLTLARTVVRTSDGAQSLVATYVGPRGCRLELWINNAATSRSEPGTDRRTWRAGGLVYELVAFGMPAERFQRVGEMAEKATRETTLPDTADRLIEARVPSAPCVS